jgi:hypothetical protein
LPIISVAPNQQRQAETNNDEKEDNHGISKEDAPLAEKKMKRDDWMMMPPKQDDLAARMDPTKQRARGFNTGKGARGSNPQGEDNSSWYETAEQKQKRLQDEMMGVSKQPSIGPQKPSMPANDGNEEAAARKLKDHMVCQSNSVVVPLITNFRTGQDQRTIIDGAAQGHESSRGRR